MIKHINDFNSYLNEIKKIKYHLKEDELLFFRRVADNSFKTLPGIYWDESISEDEAYHNLILEYPEEFDVKHNHLSTLAKMQYYGLNTRLIDISGNILVSLYFAS